MKRRTKYRQGELVTPTPYMQWIRRRCEWAARRAMVKTSAIRRIRWEWVRGLAYKDRGEDGWGELFGRVKYGRGGVTVVINVATDDHLEDTAVHEYAHALLEPVEGLRQRGPEGVDEPSHTPAWAALYGDLYQRFVDFEQSGPQR